MSRKHLLLMGPPGSGKGTQGRILAERLNVPLISTGDIFRDHVSRGTPLGRDARGYMAAGGYVPDSLTNALVRDRLAQTDTARGYILDGYPRTVDQVHELDEIVEDSRAHLDRVITLVVGEDTLVSRLLARATVELRADDTGPVITERQRMHRLENAPVAGIYRARGLLTEIDGEGSQTDVRARLEDLVDGLLSGGRHPLRDRSGAPMRAPGAEAHGEAWRQGGATTDCPVY